ncbi:uncharacterized protein LOC125663992 [Ostrea edulis]|uniref:uncharacterized protein LOC125663992 n=1 Tax=Ostrea edulis TaxID=37623 RepID=UPI0024AFAC71|nr:uncharacterized protein LOC125663992 [Ostrea edulis]
MPPSYLLAILSSLVCSSLQALTTLNVTCPPGWTQHSTYKNKCYRVVTSAVAYSSVPSHCAALLSGATVANVYNLGIHKFFADTGFLSLDKEYYIGLVKVGGGYVFPELNNEPLGSWSVWGAQTGQTCTVYANVDNVWYWQTNNCNPPRLSVCEYLVSTSGDVPVVLADGGLLSGRVEVFMNGMWGTLGNSNFSETGTLICKVLGYRLEETVVCAGAACGTGKVWYEEVKCGSGVAVNITECVAGETLSTSTNHTMDTIVRCTDSRTTTAEVTTITEETKTEISSQSIITAPITPQNNVTVIYSTVTTTVNVTVTEVTTVYVSEHVTPAPTSSTCWTASSLGVTSAASTSEETLSNTSTTISFHNMSAGAAFQALPVFKSKNTAKYSTRTRQDNRPSAKAVGWFGILILVLMLSGIVALDVGTLGKNKQFDRKAYRKRVVPKNQNKMKNGLESISINSQSSVLMTADGL